MKAIFLRLFLNSPWRRGGGHFIHSILDHHRKAPGLGLGLEPICVTFSRFSFFTTTFSLDVRFYKLLGKVKHAFLRHKGVKKACLILTMGLTKTI